MRRSVCGPDYSAAAAIRPTAAAAIRPTAAAAIRPTAAAAIRPTAVAATGPGVERSLRPKRRLKPTALPETLPDQVDEREDDRQADEARRGHGVREAGDVLHDRNDEPARALAQDQVDQHDRQDREERKLDERPEEPLRLFEEVDQGSPPDCGKGRGWGAALPAQVALTPGTVLFGSGRPAPGAARCARSGGL